MKKTIEDFDALPEGSYYQLIEGEMVKSPKPEVWHQLTAMNIVAYLLTFIEEKEMGLVVFNVNLYLDQENAYIPDIAVIFNGSKAKITEKGVYGPPDVVVEIISPSTAYYDQMPKRDCYERAGVREYWIVDPLRKSFEIYLNNEEGFNLISKAKNNGKVSSHVLGLELDLQEIFKNVDVDVDLDFIKL